MSIAKLGLTRRHTKISHNHSYAHTVSGMKTARPFEEGLCGREVEIFAASTDDINLASHLLHLEDGISKQPTTAATTAITAITSTATATATRTIRTTAALFAFHPKLCFATNQPIMSTPRSGSSVSSRGSSSRYQEPSRVSGIFPPLLSWKTCCPSAMGNHVAN